MKCSPTKKKRICGWSGARPAGASSRLLLSKGKHSQCNFIPMFLSLYEACCLFTSFIKLRQMSLWKFIIKSGCHLEAWCTVSQCKCMDPSVLVWSSSAGSCILDSLCTYVYVKHFMPATKQAACIKKCATQPCLSFDDSMLQILTLLPITCTQQQ